MSSLKTLLLGRYRCPADALPDFDVPGTLKNPKGFFRFGSNAICYGRAAGEVRSDVNSRLFDVSSTVSCEKGRMALPFDPSEVIDDLRYERYFNTGARLLEKPGVRNVYYRLRPVLPDSVRRYLQRVYLKEWGELTFPAWPVDRTVDIILERLLALALKTSDQSRIPFVWFWPRGQKAAAIVTHDIETLAGRNFTTELLDIDGAFGIRSSVQIVPEERYEVPAEFLDAIRERQCEINVHGLNHDGNLFQNRATFVERAEKINRYAALFGAKGFRSPVMYRNPDWFQELDFSYDMSFPNNARYEPQPGGCCTLLPYSLPGGMTELPLTTVQDYALFHLLNDYSTALWHRQMKSILEGYGLMSFIVHPDYVRSGREQDVYKQLLSELEVFRSRYNVWIATAGEVDAWWRQRAKMTVVSTKQGWAVEGPGSERAMIAYACRDGEKLAFEFPSEGAAPESVPSLVKEGAR